MLRPLTKVLCLSYLPSPCVSSWMVILSAPANVALNLVHLIDLVVSRPTGVLGLLNALCPGRVVAGPGLPVTLQPDRLLVAQDDRSGDAEVAAAVVIVDAHGDDIPGAEAD